MAQKPLLINETQLNPSTAEQFQAPPVRQSLNQSLISETNTSQNKKQKTYKKYKWGIGISGCCLIIFLVIGIAGPFIIQAIIRSQITSKTILGKDNEKVWASLPGDSGTDFIRNFAFFNFSNWEDFLLHGSKPQFTQIQGYKVSQLQDFLDIQWKQDDQVVGVNNWVRFLQKNDSKSLNDSVFILNPGPLGFWDTIKNSDPSLVLNQGLGITFLNVQALIKNIVVGMTINSQFLPDFQTAWSTLYQPADIDLENAKFIWHDYAHGMSSPSTLNGWIVAAEKGSSSKEAQDLGNYFTLSSSQLTSLIMSFQTLQAASNQLVMRNYYCFNKTSCSGFDLAIKQYATMDVTSRPPPSKTIESHPSICNLNLSCKNYYSEIASYYQYVFLSQRTDQKYKNLTFDQDVVRTWFWHDGDQLNKNQSFLLHLGNLQALYSNGTQYDKDPSNQEPLENIQKRFNLPTKVHAQVFWGWIKYYYNQFINRKMQGGKTDYTASALFGTQFFYQSWAKTHDRLHILLLKHTLRAYFSEKSCFQLFSQSMRIPNSTIETLCENYNIRQQKSIQKLLYVCRFKYHDQWSIMSKIVNNSLAMQQFCDRTEPDGFAGGLQTSQLFLDSYYQCDQTPLPYCSDYELAAKQWASSNITKNPIPFLPPNQFKKTTTIHDWFDDIRPFEYGHWITKFPKEKLPQINASDAYRMMNHDNLWSLNTWQQVWLQSDPQELIQRYGIYHQEVMGRYLRYVVIYVTFDGFVKQRKVRDLLFGYDDSLVKYIRQRSPLIGGDPSRPKTIHLNDLNLTQQQARNYHMQLHTGKNHPQMTAYIKTINGKSTINFNTSDWNGNQTRDFTQSPWKEQVSIVGTEGKQSEPMQMNQPFNISIFVPSAQRGISASYSGESSTKFDLKVNKFTINQQVFQSSSQNPSNDKYFQSLPGFINLTKLYSFPLYACKNHFYGIENNWNNLIEIWNENHTFQYQASKWDDSFFYVQPYSGVTFQATVYLMLNYYYQPDVLFRTQGSRMLPFFSIYNSGNFTEDGANKLLGTLKTGLAAKKAIFWVGIVIAILMLISIFALVVLFRKKKIYDKKKESLIEVESQSFQETKV